MFKFSNSSLEKLSQCDDDLQRVMKLAITRSPYDFGISEGLRSIETQRKYVDEGKSTTMNSRHLPNSNGESEACDIKVYVNGKISWDMKHFRKVAQAVFSAAIELGVQVEWGGLWESFIDGPHFQLEKK